MKKTYKNKIAVLIILIIILILLIIRNHVPNSSTRWVSVEDIEASLPQHPITIGLDVDDTVFFSSPGLYYIMNNNDGPDGKNLYENEIFRSQRFWNDLSCKYDIFSMPKNSAIKLLEMHKKRGDRIFFITARVQPEGEEILTKCLHKAFKLTNQPKTIFSGNTPKTKFIKENNIELFYGDSDSDITQAHNANIRAIRIERSPLSVNKTNYSPSAFGEEILENSAD
ncbi:MAG: acid phosphatase AphA [Candidatus Riflebacteria bacterium]|nr:acid phosphatase AphA [Candidatus Riflebacteria bacterium]